MKRSGRLLSLCLALCVAACGGDREPAQAPAAAPEQPKPGYDLESLLASADLKRGETLFLQCRACHSVGEGEPHKVGPNLHGIFGSPAASRPGFAYSDALKNAGVTWTPETLDPWLERPSDYIPGNKMVFIGIKNPADRAALIAWLMEATGAR